MRLHSMVGKVDGFYSHDWFPMPDASPTRVTADSVLAPGILKLVRQNFAHMESRIDPPSSMHRMTVETIKDQCVSSEVWAIGDPPHACIFLKERHGCLYIGKLAVDQKMRGQGLARRLIELAEKRALSKGLSGLGLETRIELVENHKTFRRLGFSKTGEGAHPGFERPTYLIMRKEI